MNKIEEWVADGHEERQAEILISGLGRSYGPNDELISNNVMYEVTLFDHFSEGLTPSSTGDYAGVALAARGVADSIDEAADEAFTVLHAAFKEMP